ALAAIVLLGAVVNRVTGTHAVYLDSLALEAGEHELWRDTAADFVTIPNQGGAVYTSFARRRRHTGLWTDRRIIGAHTPLLPSQQMITHEMPSPTRIGSVGGASEAAAAFGGGFYGRGFTTLVASTIHFGQVNGRDCIRIAATPDSRDATNVAEALV